jgi:hypothetical protein
MIVKIKNRNIHHILAFHIDLNKEMYRAEYVVLTTRAKNASLTFFLSMEKLQEN